MFPLYSSITIIIIKSLKHIFQRKLRRTFMNVLSYLNFYPLDFTVFVHILLVHIRKEVFTAWLCLNIYLYLKLRKCSSSYFVWESWGGLSGGERKTKLFVCRKISIYMRKVEVITAKSSCLPFVSTFPF